MTETRSVTLSRTFDAPIDLVYRAWTDAQQVVRWMKCEPGVELEYDDWQPEVGGRFTSVMRKPGEWEVQSNGRFTEVDPPHVLAYVQEADPKMHMPETSVRVVFEEVDGGTKLTLTHSGLPNDAMCGIVQGGWTGGFAQLDELLRQTQS